MKCLKLLVTTCVSLLLGVFVPPAAAEDHTDHVATLQQNAIAADKALFGHWGTDANDYSLWTTHSNRLIPVYTFGTKNGGAGVNLRDYTGANSRYRSEAGLRQIYGRVPELTLDPHAEWMDQTDIAAIQRAAVAAGRKYVFLVVFDGMDWDTTRAAAIHNSGSVSYNQGKGTGTHFQSYTADGTAQFGYMVTSPHNDGTKTDVDAQTVLNPGGKSRGGYSAAAGGRTPWAVPGDPGYLIAKPADENAHHAYTDSAASATSMMAGYKTYNGAINIGPTGDKLSTIAHEVQENGYAVGIVSSVPFCHATPAAAYAHNVARKDYQDISRDLLGLPSISHPQHPLPGMDVVVGCGHGTERDTSKSQGENFVPGNIYVSAEDVAAADVENGGAYVTAIRSAGKSGSDLLRSAAETAVNRQQRLFGLFGIGRYNSHLPFQTADGDFSPVPGNGKKAETYSPEDLRENPTLAEMTSAAIDVLHARQDRFWLLVEAGDVDWANHDNNVDNSIGAVNSGDAAVKSITDWVETHSNWNESVVIVTADHGHLLCLTRPELLVAPQ